MRRPLASLPVAAPQPGDGRADDRRRPLTERRSVHRAELADRRADPERRAGREPDRRAAPTAEPTPSQPPEPPPNPHRRPPADPPRPEPDPDVRRAAPPSPTRAPRPRPTPAAKPAAGEPATDTKGRPIAAGRYIVILDATADTAAVITRHGKRDGIKADRSFERVRAFAAKLDAGQRRALQADPSVVAVVPDEVIGITAQTNPTGVSRVGARRSATANIDTSTTARERGRRHRRHGRRHAPGPERRRRRQLLDERPQRGGTRTATERMSPAPSPPSTTRPASSASRPAPASGRYGSSTPTATGCCRGTSAASIGSSPSATRSTPADP